MAYLGYVVILNYLKPPVKAIYLDFFQYSIFQAKYDLLLILPRIIRYVPAEQAEVFTECSRDQNYHGSTPHGNS